MGVIEDVRKVIQDLVTPDLKALGARQDASDESTRLKIDNVLDRIAGLKEFVETSNRALTAKIDANHATVMNALNIDKRLEALEPEHRAESPSAAS
jgi:hypothetical protein